MSATALPEQSNGLMGYLSASLSPAPDNNFGAGLSYYVNTWSLTSQPIANFQVGLPSNWTEPNNNNFKHPLCPKGTYARDNWPERGPYYQDVFQTIEGGLGYWGSTQFPSATPKYRINGTPDCYSNEISSPGWGFGETTVLPPNLMGIAQLSNHILIPPDGMTFAENTNGEFLGLAWMALPLRPAQTHPQPTGNQSWTLFFNTQNFAGPVAFFIPEAWSKLSQHYKVIAGRGMDAMPIFNNTLAMEVNAVPCFIAQDNTGTTYSRIPQLEFPVDQDGNTILMQNFNIYSKDAFFTPLQNALKNNTKIPTTFDMSSNAALAVNCTADPLSFSQSNQIPLVGFDSVAQTFSNNDNGQCTFGMHWNNPKTAGQFPAYFKQFGNSRTVIAASQVPSSTHLQGQVFTIDPVGSNYNGPTNIDSNKYWNNWVGNQPPVTVTLTDGSTVVYRWYRFVDQPAIKSLGLTNAQSNALQNTIVKLHKSWPAQTNFMAPPKSGNLAALDEAILVQPPKGLEFGYVPIVIGQSHAAASVSSCTTCTNSAAKPQLTH